ncbi:MAG: 3-hydroxyacyl-ACP dehydratase FabZ [Pseudomonadota bacterium]
MSIMEIGEILKFLPHRYPFLLLDRVLEHVPGDRLRALKNVTINEPFFQGHFPGRPVMPGVLILEAMAQATGLLALDGVPQDAIGEGSIYYFVGIDKARFRRPVMPGDQLIVEITQRRNARGVIKASALATVDGQAAAEAEIMGALRQVED